MVVTIGAAPAGTGDGPPGPARPGPAGRTRRDAARWLARALAAALAPEAVACSAAHRDSVPVPASASASASGKAPDGTAFDQTYRGRRIRGVRAPADGMAGDGSWQVTVDGRPLHLMRRADGTWLSMVDHYRSYRTPLEAARAAVDELGPAQRLRDLAPGPVDAGHPHRGDRHDVRA